MFFLATKPSCEAWISAQWKSRRRSMSDFRLEIVIHTTQAKMKNKQTVPDLLLLKTSVCLLRPSPLKGSGKLGSLKQLFGLQPLLSVGEEMQSMRSLCRERVCWKARERQAWRAHAQREQGLIKSSNHSNVSPSSLGWVERQLHKYSTPVWKHWLFIKGRLVMDFREALAVEKVTLGRQQFSHRASVVHYRSSFSPGAFRNICSL